MPKFFPVCCSLLLAMLLVVLDHRPATAIEGIAYSPELNVEDLDIATINSARFSIDVAMYAFTDRKIADALILASRRGVVVRIYRDKIQIRDRNDQSRYLLSMAPRVMIRVKNNTSYNIMHLKSYVVDRSLLRTGSANWSPSAEGANCWRGNCGHGEQQDNDFYTTTTPGIVQNFERTFERIFNRPSNEVLRVAR